MSRRVLVPYDSSEQAQYALSHALRVFESAEIALVHVVKPIDGGDGEHGAGYEQQIETAERMLEGACEWYDDAERERIETVVRYGRPVRQLLEYATTEGIDQIVLGSRGREGTARLLLGSVAETVVRRSSVPVTVVRNPTEEFDPEHVLVPFDASTGSRTALEHALERFPAADVTALYVASPPVGGIEGADRLLSALGDWEDDREEQVGSVLDVAEELAAEHDRDITTTSTDGDPSDTVVGYATSGDVDHVVLGSTGRDGIARLMLGSVAETVVRRSPVTVTIAE
ncbi:MAG: universal stress protein UspA related nucleotide-binding protein [halophilic archaeon J07HX64]|jgi:Universal stress protein UspA and related nucleotide-binding proteins|nr:MAG: universal stress protein UspA related nucleotide-binding protein [halophilic archaeon J07HX64]